MADLAVVIFGGPNGSGKSTITSEIREGAGFPSTYINADDIAQDLRQQANAPSPESPSEQDTRERLAQRLADEKRLELIGKHESFAFETVMSHPSKLAIIDHAKRNGYEVVLYFVSTSDPAINVARVRQRVAEGGHGVDERKIVDRYHRSLSLLPAAAERADLTLAWDNSSAAARPFVVARVVAGQLEVLRSPAPTYYQSAFIDPFTTERPSELAEIAQTYGAGVRAELIGGVSTGPIIYVGQHFVVQQHRREVTVHDRAILEACGVQPAVGHLVRVSYHHGHATTVDPGAVRAPEL